MGLIRAVLSDAQRRTPADGDASWRRGQYVLERHR